jgi:hypothetical protein
MRDDALPYHGPRHRAAADAAKALAEAADTVKLINMLRMYADDIENDYGRAHAPQWMREAAKRIESTMPDEGEPTPARICAKCHRRRDDHRDDGDPADCEFVEQ